MTLSTPAVSRLSKHCHRRNDGFTYLGLLILITIIGIASAATMQMGAVMQRRAAEEELLDIGAEFRAALISYANATPLGQARAPQALHDLIKDPRYPGVRRHLRKLYTDPITGKEGWGTIQTLNGSGIVAIYSLSEARPIKIGNFDPILQSFTGKTRYRDWVFGITPQSIEAPLAGEASNN